MYGASKDDWLEGDEIGVWISSFSVSEDEYRGCNRTRDCLKETGLVGANRDESLVVVHAELADKRSRKNIVAREEFDMVQLSSSQQIQQVNPRVSDSETKCRGQTR